jgi:RNA polymerase sigma factor (TIGR02999 family)
MTTPPDPQLTRLLEAWRNGDSAAADKLVPLVYAELRRIAASKLRSERGGHTLQPTALVHEAWLRLMQQHDSGWQNRAQFFAIAAQAMRRILVDHARKRHAAKRGDGEAPVDIDDISRILTVTLPDERLLALDEALKALATLDARQARIIELRFFGGLSVEETASVLEVSPTTVKREWATGRAWLFRAQQGDAAQKAPDTPLPASETRIPTPESRPRLPQWPQMLPVCA